MSTRRHLAIGMLLVLMGTLLPAPASAQHFFFWWLRPPAEPVAENTVFDPVAVTQASFTKYVVTSGRITSRTTTNFTDTQTTATVSANGDELTFAGSIKLTDSATTVTVTLDPASLWFFYFGTHFYGTGTATFSDGTTIENLSICGQINTVNGEYRLRGDAIGYIYTPTTTTATTTATKSRRVRPSFELQLLHFNLSGTETVPASTPTTTGTTTKPTS